MNNKVIFTVLVLSLFSLPVFVSESGLFDKLIFSSYEIYEELPIGITHLNEINIENTGHNDFNYRVGFSNFFDLDNYTIGLWRLNEGEGAIAFDVSGNDLDFEIIGAEWVNGLFGKGLKLNGYDDYLIYNGPLPSLKSITIEAWIKTDGVDGWGPVGPVKLWEYGILYNQDGYLRSHIWSDSLKWHDSTAVLSDGNWHYVALTYDSYTGQLTTYLDGSELESKFEGRGVINNSSNPLLVGRSWTEQMWDFFGGTIDEIRISSTVKTNAEISRSFEKSVNLDLGWVKIANERGIIAPDTIETIKLFLNSAGEETGILENFLEIYNETSINESVLIPIVLNILPSDHDLGVTILEGPSSGIALVEQNIKVRVSNHGNQVEHDIRVRLLVNGTRYDSVSISELKPNERVVKTLKWVPQIAGSFDIDVRVNQVDGETYLANNLKKAIIDVSGIPSIQLSVSSILYNSSQQNDYVIEFQINNNGTAKLDFFIFDSSPSILLYDDFETFDTNWTHEGEFDSWEKGKPMIGPEFAYSGLMCWGTDLDGNYQDSSDISLISPVIDLENTTSPVLSFWHWYDIDVFGDAAYVEIWNGDGWNKVSGLEYTGYSGGWVVDNIDLSNYLGESIQVKFRLKADEYIRNKGWYVDKISVYDEVSSGKDLVMQQPLSGSIEPLENQEIEISFNEDITENIYKEKIYIYSNDFNNPKVSLQVHYYSYTSEKNVTENTINEDHYLYIDLGQDVKISEDIDYVLKIYNITTNLHPINYKWYINNTFVNNINESELKHSFIEPGVYNVTVIVGSDYNISAFDSVLIHVFDNTRPVANAGQDLEGDIGEEISFDGSQSFDNVGIIEYFWEFGDGTSRDGMFITHKYNSSGLYFVELTVFDEESNTGQDIAFVTINEPDISEDDKYIDSFWPKLVLYILIGSAMVIVLLLAFILYRIRKQ